MSTHAYVGLFKTLVGLTGAIGASILIGFPAFAESKPAAEMSDEVSTPVAQATGMDTPTEVELSPEGLEILCESFPLNSRCSGSAAPEAVAPAADPFLSDDAVETQTDDSLDGFSDDSLMEPEADSLGTPDMNTAPEESIPPEMAPMPEPKPDAPASDGFSPQGTVPTESIELNAMTPDPGTAADLSQAVPAPPTASDMEMPGGEDTVGETSVTPEELQQFVDAISQLRATEQSAQQQVDEIVAASGIEPDRFGELFQAQQAPNGAPISEITAEEQQSFDQAIAQIQGIQQEVEAQQAEIIQASVLGPQRFSEILAVVQQEPSLQQQVQQMLQN